MFDVLVVGLGAMGSAVLHHLAAQGARVVGIDRYDPPHALGSTHGRSRIIREAYYEHPGYVPLVRRAYENWSVLEKRTGVTLFERTGGLMIGAPDGALVTGTERSAGEHGIDVEVLDAHAIRARFPALAPSPGMVGVHEARAGVLFPEACVSAHLRGAAAGGAIIRTHTRVERIALNDGIVTATCGGEQIQARRAVIAAGPWTAELLEPLGAPASFTVERQTMHWLATRADDDRFRPSRMPVALIEHQRDRMFYAIPDFGDGVKAAIHYEGTHGSIDTIERAVTQADTLPVLELVRRFLPDAAPEIRESVVCAYTNSPDLHFVIDSLPAHPEVMVVSACSGHGFKFASAIGEAVASMSLGATPAVSLEQFGMARLA